MKLLTNLSTTLSWASGIHLAPPYIILPWPTLILSSHFLLCFQIFFLKFRPEFYILHVVCVHFWTWFAHPNNIRWRIQIRSFSLCNFCSSLLGLDILPNTFFSDTFNPSFLGVGDRILHPRRRSTVVVLIFWPFCFGRKGWCITVLKWM